MLVWEHYADDYMIQSEFTRKRKRLEAENEFEAHCVQVGVKKLNADSRGISNNFNFHETPDRIPTVSYSHQLTQAWTCRLGSYISRAAEGTPSI